MFRLKTIGQIARSVFNRVYVMYMELSLMTAALIASTSANDAVTVCAEDARATSIVYEMSGLPEEIRADVLEATRGNIGERPRSIRRSHVVTEENREHLNTRFYRAVLFEYTWYVQIERALMTGVHTLGYGRRQNGRYQRSIGVHFSGPPCETIRAALSGVGSSFWYLSRSGNPSE